MRVKRLSSLASGAVGSKAHLDFYHFHFACFCLWCMKTHRITNQLKPVKVNFSWKKPPSTPIFLQNQFGYRDGGPVATEGSVAAGTQACGNQEATGGLVPPLEDPRSNGNLHKKSMSQSGAEDSGGQRYSADPTIFLGDRMSRGDTDEDGYITPMKDKNSSGIQAKTKKITLLSAAMILYRCIFWR